MTTTNTYDFGEYEYGTNSYGKSLAIGSNGCQIKFVNSDSSNSGFQLTSMPNKDYSFANQVEFFNATLNTSSVQVEKIISAIQSTGYQVVAIKETSNSSACQVEVLNSKFKNLSAQLLLKVTSEGIVGNQVLLQIKGKEDYLSAQIEVLNELNTALGIKFKADKLAHLSRTNFGDYPFGSLPFGSEGMNANLGCQIEFFKRDKKTQGCQLQLKLKAKLPKGSQVELIIDTDRGLGVQLNAQSVASLAIELLATLYNTSQLRILNDFPSRGLIKESDGILNLFGEPVGMGKNWQATSTADGDFSPFNLNTDVVEQVWRSKTGITSSISLTCDTELPQGVFLDTFAMLNHNLTRAATVRLIGSNSATFATTETIINLQITDRNIYYISPTLPVLGLKYWRTDIDDPTNPNNFISVGTIIFGAAKIFSDECFVDEIDFQYKDFADRVETEGFTNVSNSRTLKKSIGLEFRLLNSSKGNYAIMRDLFTHERTVLKCLFIPTPSPTDMSIVDRFAVFGKLSSLPSERHLSKGPDANYATFNIEVDESN